MKFTATVKLDNYNDIRGLAALDFCRKNGLREANQVSFRQAEVAVSELFCRLVGGYESQNYASFTFSRDLIPKWKESETFQSDSIMYAVPDISESLLYYLILKQRSEEKGE